jgi:HlyD family secretion protein
LTTLDDGARGPIDRPRPGDLYFLPFARSVSLGRILRILIGLLLVGGLAAAAVWWYRPEPVAVEVVAVDRGKVESTVANTRAGTIKACRRAKLAPTTGGMVAELPVKSGDLVKEGDLLLRLWNDDIEAQASLARSEFDARTLQAKEKCLAADLAERDAARADSLFAEGIIGEQQVDLARSERERSRTACQASHAAVNEARDRVEAARAELAKTVLRAPFDGVVADVNTELGEVVSPSPPGIPTPPALDLIEQGCLYVLAPIDEVDAPRVAVGMPARVSLDAYPDRSFPGHVRRIAPFVSDLEKQARTVDVEIEIERPDEVAGLAPGYSADAEVLLDVREDVLRVPTEAVIEDRRVLLLDGDRLVSRDIERGASNWEYTEVASGLEPGDLVVLSLDRDGVEPGALAVRAP